MYCWAVIIPAISTLPPKTPLPVAVTLPFTVWFPINVLDAVVALYLFTNLLKSSMLIWSVVFPTTTGTTVPPEFEPDNSVIKGNSDIFLVAICQYYFKKLVFNSYKYWKTEIN